MFELLADHKDGFICHKERYGGVFSSIPVIDVDPTSKDLKSGVGEATGENKGGRTDREQLWVVNTCQLVIKQGIDRKGGGQRPWY